MSIREWKSTATISYRDVLLSQQMLPAIKHVAGDMFVLQQDNASAHRARDTIKLLQQETLDFIDLISGHQSRPESSEL